MSKEINVYQAGMLPQGSRVVVVVSQGPFPGPVAGFATVPEVVGKSQGAALEAVANNGLQAQVVYDYHEGLRKGTVMAQLPVGGSSTPSGSEAVVMVSSGDPMHERPAVALPEVIGMNETQALNTLDQAGLAPQVKYEHSATVPAGVVIAQLPDQQTFSASARSASGSKTALWVTLGIVAIVLLLAAAYFIMNSMSTTKATYTVPNVVGMQTVDATREILKAGLEVGTVTEVTPTDDTVKAGAVIKTDPEANAEVEQGTKVNLEVAKTDGTLKIAVPDVVGQSQASATAILENAGFDVTVQQKSDKTVEADKVISQTPKGGLDLPKGATVVLIVSTGPETQKVEIPDVTGLSESAARQTIMAAGLEMKKTEGSSDSVAVGNVISQVPSAGKNVDAGATVTVVISTGPATQGDAGTSGE